MTKNKSKEKQQTNKKKNEKENKNKIYICRAVYEWINIKEQIKSKLFFNKNKKPKITQKTLTLQLIIIKFTVICCSY